MTACLPILFSRPLGYIPRESTPPNLPSGRGQLRQVQRRPAPGSAGLARARDDAQRHFLVILRRAPELRERRPRFRPAVAEEEITPLVEPDPAAHSRIPAHAMPGGPVAIE